MEKFFTTKELEALDHAVPTWKQLNDGRETTCCPAWCPWEKRQARKRGRHDSVADSSGLETVEVGKVIVTEPSSGTITEETANSEEQKA